MDIDCDGDGLTNNEELTGVDDPSTEGVPDGITDPTVPDTTTPIDTTGGPIDACNPPGQAVDIDCDGDGLTNNEEITGVDDPNTPGIPDGITDPSDSEDVQICEGIEINYLIKHPSCGEPNGTLELVFDSTVSNLSFEWEPNISDGAIAENLGAGTYNVTVTDMNEVDCVSKLSILLSDIEADTIEIIQRQSANCGADDGLIVLSPSNLNYTWSDGGTGAERSDLPSGAYTIEGVNEAGCTALIELFVPDSGCGDDVEDCTPIWTEEEIALSATDCDGIAELCLDIPSNQLINYNVFVNGTITAEFGDCLDDETSFMYIYSSLNNIEEGGQFEVINWEVNGQSFSGDFENVFELAALLSEWDTTSDWTVDTEANAIQGGNRNSEYSRLMILDNNSGVSVDLGLNSLALNLFASVELDTGQHRVLLENNITGCLDSVLVTVDCNPVPEFSLTDSINVNIAIGEDTIICFEEIMDMVIENCTDSESLFSELSITSDNCLEIRGDSIGLDSFCLLVCDSLDNCEEVNLLVAVNNNLPPVLVDDQVTAIKDQNASFSSIQNDTINGRIIDIGVMADPTLGRVEYDSEREEWVYIPDSDVCGEVDSFQYFITNEIGMSIATVQINILCEEILVYSGFSPNGDGINDFLTIAGIENFPSNEVSIFNRWGNQIYTKKGYSNDDPWDGSWSGAALPDGTYFYVLIIEGREPLSGYIQVQR